MPRDVSAVCVAPWASPTLCMAEAPPISLCVAGCHWREAHLQGKAVC